MHPLEGIRVLDLTRVLAGPYCTMLLGDLGAEVIKIEQPERGDDARSFGPFIEGQSAYFLSLNRNKKSVALDLKSPQGKEVFTRLVARADVLVENFRPGTLDKLGFPWARLQAINPRLICARISGFGQTGPYRARPAYDIIVQAMGGIMSITGQPGGMPTRVGTSIGDLTAALFTTVGILAALEARAVTGRGQEIDVSMLDCQVAILENAIARYQVTGEVPAPLGNRHPSITPFTTVRTQDGYLVIALGNDGLWQKFCMLVGHPELGADPRFGTNKDRTENWEHLAPLLEQIFQERPSAEWMQLFEREGLPYGPLQNVAQVLEDPQVKERNILWELALGDSRLQLAGLPVKFSATPAVGIALPPPELGQHTAEVLAEVGREDPDTP